jgi:hypothetical protein
MGRPACCSDKASAAGIMPDAASVVLRKSPEFNLLSHAPMNVAIAHFNKTVFNGIHEKL